MNVLAWVGTAVIAWCVAGLFAAFVIGAAIRVSRAPDPPCREE